MLKYITAIVLLAFGFEQVFAQGCSDAGICTMSSFEPHHQSDTTLPKLQNEHFKAVQTFTTGLNYGFADYDITVAGWFAEYEMKATPHVNLNAKITALLQTGNQITSVGLSDLFLSGTYVTKRKVAVTAGFKIPLMLANKTESGLPLPMDYQASLGTLDFILGLGFAVKKLQVVAGLQYPLTQNSNAFKAADYPANNVLNQFQSTNGYQRAADVLLRLSYPINIGKKWILTPSVLPIYHLNNDQYLNAANVLTPINGSKGLTLNVAAFASYYFKSNKFLRFTFGAPTITRSARPDGLTRAFVAGLEFVFSW